MKPGKERERRAEALAKAIERVLGDPMEADESEIVDLFAELGQGSDSKRRVFEFAAKAAQKHRLEKRPVPVHVRAAMQATREVDLDAADSSRLQKILDSGTKAFLGRTPNISYAYRNRKGEFSEKDNQALEELAEELKEDWGEGEKE